MYVPKHFTADDDVVRDLLSNMEAADLITATGDGPVGTFLPLLYDGSVGDHGALLGPRSSASSCGSRASRPRPSSGRTAPRRTSTA